jgi:hypothetical protein
MRFIDFLETTFSKEKFEIKKRARYDINTLKFNSEGNLGVLSVDLQGSNLKQFKDKKIKILLSYHKEIQKICKKESIPFILTVYGRDEEHELKDDFNLRYIKETPSSTENTQINSYFQRENVTSVYVSGVVRSICIFATLNSFQKLGYQTFTSIIGTAMNKNLYSSLNTKKIDRTEENSKKIETVKQLYSEFEVEKYSLKTELSLLKQMGVKILDYKN